MTASLGNPGFGPGRSPMERKHASFSKKTVVLRLRAKGCGSRAGGTGLQPPSLDPKNESTIVAIDLVLYPYKSALYERKRS